MRKSLVFMLLPLSYLKDIEDKTTYKATLFIVIEENRTQYSSSTNNADHRLIK